MNAGKRICAYYSTGPHFRRMLERLRQDSPDAVIAAWIPPGLPLSDAERSLTDEVVVTELAHYSPRNVRACARLVKQIRAKRFDVFSVMFQSPQLSVLAALSGARECVYITPRGQRIVISRSVARVAATWLTENVRGRMRYAWIWLAVRLFKTHLPGK